MMLSLNPFEAATGSFEAIFQGNESLLDQLVLVT